MFVWTFDPTLIQIGTFQIRWYGVLFALALMGGFYIWRWQMLRGGHTEQQAERFLLLGVIGVIAGSRLGHVLFYEPERYLSNPLEILAVWRGGLASHGATIGITLVLIYFARREKIPILEVTDRFTMAAAWGAILVRVGNFLNSEIIGRVTDVAWKVKFPLSAEDRGLSLDQVPWRHPSQIYEALLGIAVLGILYLVDRKLGEKRPRGLLTFLFFTLYFSGRFFIEFAKEYQTLSPESSPLTMGQYLSIPFFLFGVAGLIHVARRPRGAEPATT